MTPAQGDLSTGSGGNARVEAVYRREGLSPAPEASEDVVWGALKARSSPSAADFEDTSPSVHSQNSNPKVLMIQSSKNRNCHNASNRMCVARVRGIFAQRQIVVGQNPFRIDDRQRV